MARFLIPLAALLAVVALSGCASAIAAVMAPEMVAGQAAAAGAQSAVAGLNDAASDASTLGDLDRILSKLPEDSPQRQDLSQLREELSASRTVRPVNGARHRFASDPRGGLEYDRRVADVIDRSDARTSLRGYEVATTDTRGHRLVLDPPRVVGGDVAGPRDQRKPFHASRGSDLDEWRPRYYGPTLPRLPSTRVDHRGQVD